jgi:AraC-like DNA-binding protein
MLKCSDAVSFQLTQTRRVIIRPGAIFEVYRNKWICSAGTGKGIELMTSRLDRVRDWASLAKASRYSATAIARECGVSPRQLERFFHERMNKPPHQWLRDLRMGRAVELLREGASVKVAAQELCYKDAAHFCRDFKNYFGTTPGQIAAQQSIIPSAGLPPTTYVAFRQ